MHGDSDGETTLSSLLVLCVTIVFFGSNFVPIKNVTIKNYAFFQWAMCNAILLTVIPWCLTQGRPVQLHPIAFIGGVAWCCGNYLCPMILDKLGLGVGSLLWGTVEMFVAWLSGTFGILGVERQTIQRPWLNFLGVMIIVSGGIVLAQVSSDTATSTIDTSEFSALSSLPVDATELSPTKSITEERKDHEDGEEAGVEMDRIFAISSALSPCGPTVYQSNPMLDVMAASLSHVSVRMRSDSASAPREAPRSASHPSAGDGNEVTNPAAAIAVSAPVDCSPSFHSRENRVTDPSTSAARAMHVSTPTPSSTDSRSYRPSVTGPPLHTSTSPNVTTTSTPIDPLFPRDDSVHLLAEHDGDVEKATMAVNSLRFEREPTTTTAAATTCPQWLQLQPYEEGIVLALVAGALFGLNFNPIQHLVDHSDGRVTAGELIVSHYVGICYTSYALFLLSMFWSRYSSPTNDTPTSQPSVLTVDYECILPAIASGVMWGIGAIAWFVAAESLPISVTFPLISAGPNLVTMTWSLVYFREVRGRRDLVLLSLALTLLGVGLFCVWFSNL